jgi:hypothetical protein
LKAARRLIVNGLISANGGNARKLVNTVKHGLLFVLLARALSISHKIVAVVLGNDTVTITHSSGAGSGGGILVIVKPKNHNNNSLTVYCFYS